MSGRRRPGATPKSGKIVQVDQCLVAIGELLDLLALEAAQQEIERGCRVRTLMGRTQERHAGRRSADAVEIGVRGIRAPPQHLLDDEPAQAVGDEQGMRRASFAACDLVRHGQRKVLN